MTNEARAPLTTCVTAVILGIFFLVAVATILVTVALDWLLVRRPPALQQLLE